MLSHTSRTAIGCALALTFLTSMIQAFAAAGGPSFTGTWKLNREQSDKQHDVIILKGGGANSEPREHVKPTQEPSHIPLPPPGETLKITHNDPEFTVTPVFPHGEVLVVRAEYPSPAPPAAMDGPQPAAVRVPLDRTIYTDGRTIKRELGHGASIESTARWEGAQILIEEKLPFGGKAIETYELSPDGRQLYVTMRIEDESKNLNSPTIRRVFDRVDAN